MQLPAPHPRSRRPALRPRAGHRPAALLALLALLLVVADRVSAAASPPALARPPSLAAGAPAAQAATRTPAATAAPRPDAYPALPAGLPAARVVRVVDGDTVEVELGGRPERVRLIGIDTPETVHPSRPVECYGREASARATELLEGQRVLLEEDRTQDSRDRYGRLLRYLWLADGRLVNLELVADGYAFEYTYRTPYRYADVFRAAQGRARDEGRGLWAPEACNGQHAPAGATPVAPTPPPGPSPTPLPASAAPSAAALPPSFDGCAADPAAGRAPHRPIRVVGVDKVAETVTLQNVGPAAIDLRDWTMCSVKGTQRHPIGGTLAAGETRSFANTGRNIWNNRERDPGLLYDPSGRLVSAWADE